jgi:hypothetical protein
MRDDRQHSAQLLLHEHLAALVDCVDLKHVLGQVNADSRNLHGERSFSVQVVYRRLHFGTSMPLWVGAFIPLLTKEVAHHIKQKRIQRAALIAGRAALRRSEHFMRAEALT